MASVFDDLLADATESVKSNGHGVHYVKADDVRIDGRGMASAQTPADWDALAPLLAHSLGGGDDRVVPPPARTLVERLESDDPDERPADAEQLRQWLRDALGAPATREEVAACLDAATQPAIDEEELESLPTLPPEPSSVLPFPALAEDDDSDLPTLLPELGARPADEEEALEYPLPVEEPSLVRDADAPAKNPVVPSDASVEREPPPLSGGLVPRRVVRHRLPQPDRPVSVNVAPAARRSARPIGGDSLILPAGRSSAASWVAAIAVAVVVIYFLFFAR